MAREPEQWTVVFFLGLVQKLTLTLIGFEVSFSEVERLTEVFKGVALSPPVTVTPLRWNIGFGTGDPSALLREASTGVSLPIFSSVVYPSSLH